MQRWREISAALASVAVLAVAAAVLAASFDDPVRADAGTGGLSTSDGADATRVTMTSTGPVSSNTVPDDEEGGTHNQWTWHDDHSTHTDNSVHHEDNSVTDDHSSVDDHSVVDDHSDHSVDNSDNSYNGDHSDHSVSGNHQDGNTNTNSQQNQQQSTITDSGGCQDGTGAPVGGAVGAGETVDVNVQGGVNVVVCDVWIGNGNNVAVGDIVDVNGNEVMSHNLGTIDSG